LLGSRAAMRAMASPELLPGAACPWISYAGSPLKRASTAGAFDHEVRAKDENGAICPSAARTNQSVRSSGDER
jgi:hypothetical protein